MRGVGKSNSISPRQKLSHSVAAERHPDWNEDRTIVDSKCGLVGVFDGMGGVAGGEAAAVAAQETFLEGLKNIPTEDDPVGRMRWLQSTMLDASRAVIKSRKKPLSQSATTATVACRAEDVLLIASVGDSRAWRWQKNSLEQLSEDGGVISDEIKYALDHLTTQEELDGDPALKKAFDDRNIIDMALGFLPDVPDVIDVEVEEGDIIIVTSDGVHDNLTPKEIAKIIENTDPDDIAKVLVKAARKRSKEDHVRSKDDDISVAILEI